MTKIVMCKCGDLVEGSTMDDYEDLVPCPRCKERIKKIEKMRYSYSSCMERRKN